MIFMASSGSGLDRPVRAMTTNTLLALWFAFHAVAVASVADPRFFDGSFEPFPACQAKYSAP